MNDLRPLLLRVLLDPGLAGRLALPQWDLLIRQARRGNLIARLASQLEPQLEQLPAAPARHLRSALLIAARQRLATTWEVGRVRAALAPIGVEPILLKGAAYLIAQRHAAQGRLFSDVDILIPRHRLDDVEQALAQAGWEFAQDLSAYDQRYYREWMHELPPLFHRQRQTGLDVHHTILPPTARVQVNTAALFEDVLQLDDGSKVLAPITMFLHSAAHLFHEGELDNGLRDLFDLDALLREFDPLPGFWADLLPRARHLGLSRPLYYALRYTRRWLGTPVPDAILEAAQAEAPFTPALMDCAFDRGLMPVHASCNRSGTAAARLALYVRSHALRMPANLLLTHLARKAWLRMQPPVPDA